MSQIGDPVYIVDIIGDVCAKVSVDVSLAINYQYGLTIQILETLKGKDGSLTLKGSKYPLIALQMPIIEKRGNGYYADVSIRKIVICHLTKKDDRVTQKYENVFKTILYPVYYSFLRQLARNQYLSCKDPDMIQHQKVDFPGTEPLSGIGDFVDTIEITNLNFPLKQIKYC
jgi:hypothetical protein